MLKSRIRSGSVAGSAVLFSVLGLLPCACASPLPVFTLYNSDADGSVVTPSGLYPGDSTSFDLIGGNNGSGLPGETDYAGMSSVAGTVQFQWSYTSCFPPNTGSSACDDPGYDWTGYFVGTTFTVADQTQLTDTDTGGVTVSLSFAVPANTQFGWYVGTLDNLGEPGTITVSDVTFTPTSSATPEPATLFLCMTCVLPMLLLRRRIMKKSNQKAIQMSLVALLGAALSSGTVFGQQSTFGGTVITAPLGPGLQLTATTNLTTLSQASTLTTTGTKKGTPEVARNMRRFRMPPLKSKSSGTVVSTPSLTKALQVASAPTNAGFTGLTHADQRNANGGNQFSTEPANPNIAVANGYVLNVVNDAVRVFSTTGVALTNPVSLNQIFALAPAINWNVTPNVYGTFLLDSRAFYDQDFSRWFVLAQDQDNDASGNYLSSSHIYLAVSQTSDPTGGYNVYSMDSSDTSNPGCPCYQDYVQIGADHYGIYITSDEFSIQDLTNTYFNDAQVLAIAKSDLSSGVATPQMYQFLVPNYGDGFEAFIRPASVPPGASNFLASGGAEFLVSSDYGGYDYRLAIWAVTNTASLQSSNPALLLTQNFVNTSTYYYLPPDGISQKPGPLTLGNTEEYLDGSDVSYSLVISAVYAGGRLFVTVPTEVANFTTFTIQAGGFYAVFAPTLRNGVLSSPPPDKQGNLSITGDGILRPAITVNAQGTGIIAFTVSGPDYYPSAGYANFDLTSATPSTVQIVGQGYSPEDGFTGYNQVTLVNPSLCPTCQGDGVARWGDFSTAVTSSDGSFWYCVEYIPNAITYPRTPLANWGTFIGQYSLLTPTSAARQ